MMPWAAKLTTLDWPRDKAPHIRPDRTTIDRYVQKAARRVFILTLRFSPFRLLRQASVTRAFTRNVPPSAVISVALPIAVID
jgi:hypothetical protein